MKSLLAQQLLFVLHMKNENVMHCLKLIRFKTCYFSQMFKSIIENTINRLSFSFNRLNARSHFDIQ